MEAGRRAGRAVIGNYRVVAHGGSRERSRERADKNASTLASGAPTRHLSGGEFIEITAGSYEIIRNNLLRSSRARVKSRAKVENKILAGVAVAPCKRPLGPTSSGGSDSRTPTPLRMRETRTGLGAVGERRPADFSPFDANIFALYPGRGR